MRILIVSPRARHGAGAVANSSRGLAKGLAEAGADVTVAAIRANEPRPADGLVRWESLRLVGRPYVSLPLELPQLVTGMDVVLVNSGWAPHNIWTARAARRAEIPYVISPRGAYNPNVLLENPVRKRLWWVLAERRFLLDARAVHLFFPEERAYVEALGYNGPVILAPNGIEPPRAQWDGGSGDYLIWMGRFDIRTKGLDCLIEAMAALEPPDRPKLRLYGSGEEGKQTVRSIATAEGVVEWVEVHPFISGTAKQEALIRAKGFVFPSRWDAHSVAVLEAASLGLPLLVSDQTMIGPNLSKKGAAIVSSLETADLANGIKRVLSDEGSRVAATARALVRRDYQWKAVARRFLDQLAPLL